jgi:hypothetical protein
LRTSITHLLTNATAACLLTVSAHASTLYLTNTQNNLLRIDSAAPQMVQSSLSITGLASGESLLGIDFRPATGGLYGLGSGNRIYTIDTNTGAATAVGASGQFALTGSSFGVDFNPVPDRMRVTSNTGQDLRLNPNDGTLTAVDGTLAYAAGDANAGRTPNVAGSAYTNSIAGAQTTTLYDIDLATGSLVIQNPPNNGTLLTVGSLGVSATGPVGFDILPVSGLAYASLTAPGGYSSLYLVNLQTGAASIIGGIGSNQTITGLAAVSDVPEPSTIALALAGLTALFFTRRRWAATR